MLFSFVCIIVAFFSIFVISKPKHIFKYLMLVYALNTIRQSYGLNSIIISIGGISLYLEDLPIIIMFLLVFLRGAKIYKSRVSAVIFFVFFTIVYSSVIGLIQYGVNRYYLSDIRVFLSMIVPVIYFYNCPHEITESDIRFANKIIALMVGYCYLCWGLYVTTGIKLSSSNAAGGFRVWGSTGAIIIAFATMIYIYDDVARKKRKNISMRTLLCIVAVIVLQHNSVWAAISIGIVVLLIAEGLDKKIVLRFLMQIVLIVALFAIVITILPENPIVQAVLSSTEKYNQMGTGEGTIGGRQMIWEGYLKQLSKFEWLIGKPIGTGWLVEFKGDYGLHPPHNAYVQGIMRIGLLGTIPLFGLLIFIFVKNIFLKNNLYAALIIASLVYLYAYMFSMEMSCVWGCLIGLTYGRIYYRGSDKDEGE